MNHEARAVIERPFNCTCGKCEEAIQDMLRMEWMMCARSKTEVSRRRNELRRIRKLQYDRRRYAAARRG